MLSIVWVFRVTLAQIAERSGPGATGLAGQLHACDGLPHAAPSPGPDLLMPLVEQRRLS